MYMERNTTTDTLSEARNNLRRFQDMQATYQAENGRPDPEIESCLQVARQRYADALPKLEGRD